MFETSAITLDTACAEGYLPALETFACPYGTNENKTGVIRIVFPEFTCLCPKTGYPDFAVIHLYYLPNRLCVELKSWKLYLNAFRMVGTFHESLTHHLYTTIRTTLQPRWALVVGDFLPRGNVDTTVVFETPGTRPAGADTLIEKSLPRCSQPRQ